PVTRRADLTLGAVLRAAREDDMPPTPHHHPTLRVLIPMAGSGRRFTVAGYTFPKPLVEVHGEPMIATVVRSLNLWAKFIYLVQRSHYDDYQLKFLLNILTPGCEIVIVDGPT